MANIPISLLSVALRSGSIRPDATEGSSRLRREVLAVRLSEESCDKESCPSRLSLRCLGFLTCPWIVRMVILAPFH
jgi:hypothetical protein